MKKIALCLSGQPRNFQNGFNNIKQTILDENVDVHLHGWWHVEDVDKQYLVTPHTGFRYQYYNLPDTDKQLIESYKPKTYIFERSQFFFMPRPYNIYVPHTNIYSRYSAMATKFYSMEKTLINIKQYEKDNNIEYDWILLTRYDIALNKKIQSFLQNPNIDEGIYIGKRNEGAALLFSDNIWLMSKKFKYEFIDLFSRFDDNVKALEKMTPEKIENIRSYYSDEWKYRSFELFDKKEIHGENMLALQLVLNNTFVNIKEITELTHSIIR